MRIDRRHSQIPEGWRIVVGPAGYRDVNDNGKPSTSYKESADEALNDIA